MPLEANGNIGDRISPIQDPPRWGQRTFRDVFWARGWPKPATLPLTLLIILLIMAGIETNPGPTKCGSCAKNLGRSSSVWCHRWGCGWVHLKCSGLPDTSQHNRDFVCPKCRESYNVAGSPTRESYNVGSPSFPEWPKCNLCRLRILAASLPDWWLLRIKDVIGTISQTVRAGIF